MLQALANYGNLIKKEADREPEINRINCLEINCLVVREDRSPKLDIYNLNL